MRESMAALVAIGSTCSILLSGCAEPVAQKTSTDAQGNRTWALDAARHADCAVIDDTAITESLSAAAQIWGRDIDREKENELDNATPMVFSYQGPPAVFPDDFAGPQFNVIQDEEHVNALMDSPKIGQWILFVTSTWDGRCAGTPGKGRILITSDGIEDPGLYAHELGHNAGNGERESATVPDLDTYLEDGNVYCGIMRSAPGDEKRELANKKERDNMLKWKWP